MIQYSIIRHARNITLRAQNLLPTCHNASSGTSLRPEFRSLCEVHCWYFVFVVFRHYDHLSSRNQRLFSVPPTKFFWETSENILTNRFEYKPESFSFKLILKVIVKDSDTNFVHNFSLSSHAFLMKKSTASCFKSSIDT